MSVLGMDVGSRCIKLVEMTGSRKPQIVRAFLVETPVDAVVDGEIRNMEALFSKLQQTIQQNHIKPKELHISLHSSQLASRDIRLPSLKREEIMPAVEFDLSQSFPGIMQSHTLGYLQYSKVGEPVNGMAAFCPTRILDGYVELARQLALPLTRIDAAFNASVRACTTFNILKATDDTVMLLDIGATSAQVSVLSKGRLILSRTVGAGATQVDDIMVSRFGVTPEQAEKVRRDGSYAEYDVKDEDIGTFIRLGYSSVEDMIRQTLDFYRYNKSQEPPIQKIYLTGGGSIFKGLDSYLHEVFNLPVETLQISLRGLPANLKSELFLSAIGAGIESFILSEDINLIPNLRALSTAKSRGSQRGLVYATAGIIVLAALAFYGAILWMEANETNRKADLDARAASYSSINEVKKEIAKITKQNAGMTDVLDTAASGNFVHTKLLDTVTENMPLGLFVQNYSAVGRSSLSLTGVAMTRDDVAVLLNHIKSLDGIKDVHVESVSTRLGEDGLPIDYNFTMTANMKQ